MDPEIRGGVGFRCIAGICKRRGYDRIARSDQVRGLGAVVTSGAHSVRGKAFRIQEDGILGGGCNFWTCPKHQAAKEVEFFSGAELVLNDSSRTALREWPMVNRR